MNINIKNLNDIYQVNSCASLFHGRKPFDIFTHLYLCCQKLKMQSKHRYYVLHACLLFSLFDNKTIIINHIHAHLLELPVLPWKRTCSCRQQIKKTNTLQVDYIRFGQGLSYDKLLRKIEHKADIFNECIVLPLGIWTSHYLLYPTLSK